MTDYPYNVHTYQFQELDSARKMAKEFGKEPKTAFMARVSVAHPTRRLAGPQGTSSAIMLDVTRADPDEAIAAYDLANPALVPT